MSLGLGGSAVTDAAVQGNILAVTSHVENIFELHTILLEGPTLEARHLHKETFEGEVTCLGLCNIGGKAHAVACLWRNSAIFLDLYNIQDKQHVKTIPIQSRKYTIEGPWNEVAWRSLQLPLRSCASSSSQNSLKYCIGSTNIFISQHSFTPLPSC